MADAAAEHSALVAKVTEYLRLAEAAAGGFLAAAHPVLLSAQPTDAIFLAAHDPSWAIRSHRQALETLNRHHPELQREWVPPQYAPNPPGPAIETRPAHMWEHWVCDGCDIWTNMGEAQREYENCPEVAGVRAVYLPEE